MSARARPRGGGKRPRDARRDRGKILPLREIQAGEGGSNARLATGRSVCPATPRRRRLPRRARRFRIRAGRTERDVRSHGRSGGGRPQPTVALPALGRARPLAPAAAAAAAAVRTSQPGAEDRDRPHRCHLDRGGAPDRAGEPGRTWLITGCSRRAQGLQARAVGGGPLGGAARRLRWVEEAGRGVGVRSVQVQSAGRVEGCGGFRSGRNVACFPFGGHFSTKLSTAQVKVLGSSLFGASSLCKASEHCAALKSGFSKNQPAWRP